MNSCFVLRDNNFIVLVKYGSFKSKKVKLSNCYIFSKRLGDSVYEILSNPNYSKVSITRPDRSRFLEFEKKIVVETYKYLDQDS